MKDYYKTLEVDRNADEKSIKAAYRKLANQWHPDKHQSEGEEQRKSSEEKFKEISEAYAVLSDPEKKANYDMSGDPTRNRFGFQTTGDPFEFFRGFNFRREPPGTRPLIGQQVQLPLVLPLVEALFGTERPLQYQVQSPCNDCGMRGGTEFSTCEDCKGTGMFVRQEPNVVFQTTCMRCRGQGQSVSKICEKCSGNRSVVEDRKIVVKVPPGLQNGYVLKVGGAGGKGFNGGPDGDLLLQISVVFPTPDKFTDQEAEDLKRLLSK